MPAMVAVIGPMLGAKCLRRQCANYGIRPHGPRCSARDRRCASSERSAHQPPLGGDAHGFGPISALQWSRSHARRASRSCAGSAPACAQPACRSDPGRSGATPRPDGAVSPATVARRALGGASCSTSRHTASRSSAAPSATKRSRRSRGSSAAMAPRACSRAVVTGRTFQLRCSRGAGKPKQARCIVEAPIGRCQLHVDDREEVEVHPIDGAAHVEQVRELPLRAGDVAGIPARSVHRCRRTESPSRWAPAGCAAASPDRDGWLRGPFPARAKTRGCRSRTWRGSARPAPAGSGRIRPPRPAGPAANAVPGCGRREFGQRPMRPHARRPLAGLQGRDLRQDGCDVLRQHLAAGHPVAQRDIEPGQVRDGSGRAFGAARVGVGGRRRLTGFDLGSCQPVAQGQRRAHRHRWWPGRRRRPAGAARRPGPAA